MTYLDFYSQNKGRKRQQQSTVLRFPEAEKLRQEVAFLNQEINELAAILAQKESQPEPGGGGQPTPPAPTLPDNLLLKSLIQEEQTFYVRTSEIFGNNGESESEAFASIEEALVVLSSRYEVSGHLILDLGESHTLNCWYLPNFTGSGKITFKGNNTTIRFIKYQESTEAFFSNWSGLSVVWESLKFDKGDCTKVCIEGGKITLKNIDFGNLNVEFDNCRTTILDECVSNFNSSKISAIRSNLELLRCNLIAEFKYCQLNLFACTFNRYFTIEACNVILNNPRFNYRYFTQTLPIINSVVEFKNSWLTFELLGGETQNKTLIAFQSCSLKDFPNNIDIQGNKTFNKVSILKLVNCTTPEVFPNVSYNFSKHRFNNGASAIELLNTAILQDIRVIGATIKKDFFSVLGGKDYDNSISNLPAETLKEAIDYLYQLIIGN